MDRSKHIYLITYFIIVSLFSLATITPLEARTGEERTRILLLCSYDASFPTFSKQIAGLKSELPESKYIIEIEFLDSKRFPSETDREHFSEMLEAKLSQLAPYSLIVTADDNALKFAMHYRRNLFKNAPIVFFGVNDLNYGRSVSKESDVTGVLEFASLEENLHFISRVFPSVSKVNVLADDLPSSQADLHHLLNHCKRPKDLHINILDLSQLTFNSLYAKLDKLDPQQDVVLILSPYKDREGTILTFGESLRIISVHSSVPVIHPWEHGIGEGAFGGKVVSHFNQAQAAAKLAIKMLEKGKNGEHTNTALIEKSPNQWLFDYQQLVRFGIKTSELPEGFTLVNDDELLQKHYFYDWLRQIIPLILALVGIVLLFSWMWIYQRKISKDLHISEAKYRTLYDNAPLPYHCMKTDGTIVDTNPQWLEFMGFERNDVIGKRFKTFLHPEDRPVLATIIPKTDHVSGIQLRLIKGNKETATASFEMTSAEADEVNLIYCTFKDITEQKSVEKEITLSSHRMELALAIANTSLIDWQLKEQKYFSDQKMLKRLGYPDDHAIYQLTTLLERLKFLVADEDIRLIDKLDSMIGVPYVQELDDTARVRKFDGTYCWYRMILKTVEVNSTDHSPTRILGILVDVNDEKLKEIERLQQEEQVMKADKLATLGTLSAGVAHEINNPNQVILSGINFLQISGQEMLQLLEGLQQEDVFDEIAGFPWDEFKDRFSDSLENIRKNSRRISLIVKELKNYVREQETMEFSKVDISSVMMSAQMLTANIGKKYTDTFTWTSDSDLWVKGNYQRLEQVFVNLLINAFESLTEKKQQVIVHTSSQNGYVEIKIEDQGSGIEEKNLSKITDPFFTTKQQTGGTGMGLSITSRIIDEHNGKLNILSEPGKGTSITVSIPEYKDRPIPGEKA